MFESNQSQRPENEKEWRLIEKMLMNSVSEQKKARRWGIFFKFLTFAYLFLLLIIMVRPGFDSGVGLSSSPHTALIDIQGVVAASEDANADLIVGSLRKAFEEEQAKAIVLRINSPGGSPVQAGYIYDEIVRLRLEYPDKKVYAVIADIGASGGYYIAAAADEIYADKASLVGSIGVTASGFGFVETMDKLGVERRIFTAGEHKTFLDPFLPVNEDERVFWQEVLNTTHRQFIEQVENGRGERLKKGDPLLYSGVVWSGEQALELGLVDGLGSSSYVAREIVGYKDIVNYTARPNRLDELFNKLGTSLGKGVAHVMMTSTVELR